VRLDDAETRTLSGVFGASGGIGALEKDEQRTALEVVVNLLKPEDRESLGLVYFQGLPIDEAARRAGVSRGALDMRLMRARQRLAERLVDWADGDWSQEVAVDRKLTGANPKDYDALVLPGGVINPDQLRLNEKAVAFVRAFVDQGKPIGAICHGPWTLINAKAVARRKMTSWPSLRCDLENAGAQWIDQEVVVDEGLVTSRKPDDLPAFNAKLIEEIAQGRQRRVA
jgi:protease I